MQATRAVNTTAIIGKARQLWPLPGSEVNTRGDSIATGAARAFEEEETMKVPHPDTLLCTTLTHLPLRCTTLTHLPLPLYDPDTLTPSLYDPDTLAPSAV